MLLLAATGVGTELALSGALTFTTLAEEIVDVAATLAVTVGVTVMVTVEDGVGDL